MIQRTNFLSKIHRQVHRLLEHHSASSRDAAYRLPWAGGLRPAIKKVATIANTRVRRKRRPARWWRCRQGFSQYAIFTSNVLIG